MVDLLKFTLELLLIGCIPGNFYYFPALNINLWADSFICGTA